MSESQVSDLITQLESFPTPKDEAQRLRLFEAVRAYSLNIQDERTTQLRALAGAMTPMIALVASNLNLFSILSSAPSPLSTASLASQTGADPALLARLLRYLLSEQMVHSPRASHWTPSPQTHIFANPAYAAGLRVGMNLFLPGAAATPAFLAKTHYRNPSSATHCPSSFAFNTDKPAFEWAAAHRPDILADFNVFMAESHKAQRTGWDVLPLGEIVGETGPEEVVFVDVGGGVGRTCAELRERFPGVRGRVVNQDMRGTVEAGVRVEGVEHMVVDFFGEQPVKGARAYGLRRILHDWPDDKCVEILGRVREAMGTESVLLADDIVLPDEGAHWFAACSDLVMMMGFGAGERSREDFERIMDQAGLRIREVYCYVEQSRESVLVCVPK